MELTQIQKSYNTNSEDVRKALGLPEDERIIDIFLDITSSANVIIVKTQVD